MICITRNIKFSPLRNHSPKHFAVSVALGMARNTICPFQFSNRQIHNEQQPYLIQYNISDISTEQFIQMYTCLKHCPSECLINCENNTHVDTILCNDCVIFRYVDCRPSIIGPHSMDWDWELPKGDFFSANTLKHMGYQADMG